MKRPAREAETLKQIAAWRSAVPDLTLRSTFIVGFPGETEAEFQQLLDWLDEAQLDRVGCFRYEAVTTAAANELPDAVPETVKDERWHRLMAHQQAISSKRMATRIGSIQPVIIDSADPNGAVGRSRGDAPEIDGQVLFADPGTLSPGDIVTARILAADEYDLHAEVAN